jgi:hypothetical protein
MDDFAKDLLSEDVAPSSHVYFVPVRELNKHVGAKNST